jgi:hypothetical protein
MNFWLDPGTARQERRVRMLIVEDSSGRLTLMLTRIRPRAE